MPIPDEVQAAIDARLGKVTGDPLEAEAEKLAEEYDPDDGYAEDIEEELKAKAAKLNAAALEEKKPKIEYIEPPVPPSDAKKALVAQIGEILQGFNNQESNIPVDHDYWNLVTKYRGM